MSVKFTRKKIRNKNHASIELEFTFHIKISITKLIIFNSNYSANCKFMNLFVNCNISVFSFHSLDFLLDFFVNSITFETKIENCSEKLIKRNFFCSFGHGGWMKKGKVFTYYEKSRLNHKKMEIRLAFVQTFLYGK